MNTKIFVGYYIFVHCLTHCQTEEAKPPETGYGKSQVWQSHFASGQWELFEILAKNRDIYIWNIIESTVDYLVRPRKFLRVQSFLKNQNISHKVLINGIKEQMDKYRVPQTVWDTKLRSGNGLDWNSYPTLGVIESYLDSLVKKYPVCTLHSLGVTAENRTIKMLRISNNNPSNDVIVLQAGAHAREWIGVAALLYILNEISINYPKQPSHIRDKEWNIIPVLNPDGYVYSHTKDRLWRKNRHYVVTNCVGVDVNRNFGVEFSGKYRETDPCLDSFSGINAYSEAESGALYNLITKMKKPPKAFVDFHSYGQLILYPWASKGDNISDTPTHSKMAEGMVQEIKKATNRVYRHGRIHKLVHPSTGVALDFVYSTGIRHAYVIEARGDGKYGFLLPPSQIEDTGKELYAAIRYLSLNVNTIV